MNERCVVNVISTVLGAQTMRKVVADYLHRNFLELTARESW